MKKQFTKILILVFVLGLVPINFSNAANIATRLKGRILLQVESNGEAWYVNPDNENRYYLGRPADAFQIMRELGLGISNKDFDSFSRYAPRRLSGKILLKVEDSGKAYYVNPVDLKMHYLGKPADAFQIMRDLGLGITNSDLNTILENGQIDTSNLKLLSNAEIIEQLKDSVVYLETNDGSGSGFIIESNGYILTNAHVVQGVSEASVILSNNNTLSASVVGRDENIDLALLKVEKTGLRKAVLGDSDTVKQGDEIFTLGYPFGIKGDVSFKEGTISRTLKGDNYEYFETSADIHPGNSGGPLVNRYGQVVGINTAVFGESIYGISLGETIKLAIPINIALESIPKLKSGINVLLAEDNSNNSSSITPPTNDSSDDQSNNCRGNGSVYVSSYYNPYSKEYTNVNQILEYLTIKFTSLNSCEIQIEGIKITMYYKYLTSNYYSQSNTVFEDIEVWELSNNKLYKRVYSSGEWAGVKVVIFPDPLIIEGNSSKSYAFFATIPRGFKGTYYMKIESASSITTQKTTISGAFPINGNYITFN